jgi:hypothetical protein
MPYLSKVIKIYFERLLKLSKYPGVGLTLSDSPIIILDRFRSLNRGSFGAVQIRARYIYVLKRLWRRT